MPKIGMRIVKSSLGVGICLLISLFRSEGIVFYSCIAAVLCIQQDVAGSKKVALNRVKGTLLGGCFGLAVLMVEKSYFPVELLYARYLLITVMIIPIIYTTVVFKVTSASYISCVVFMSVTISHGMDVNPLGFTLNRMFDTLIGIFVALALNAGYLFRYQNKKALFVTNLDQTLLEEKGEMSSYTKVKLKQLLEQGAHITIATRRTPSTFLSMIDSIPFSLPIIVLNGAATYDMKQQEYHNCQFIQPSLVRAILTSCSKCEYNCFVYTIKHDMLHVYYEALSHEAEQEYYHRNRKTPYKNMICHPLPDEANVLNIHLIQPSSNIECIIKELEPYIDMLHIVQKKSMKYEGFIELDIYDHLANKHEAVHRLMKTYGFEQVYAFGSDIEDVALLSTADKSFVVSNADTCIQQYGEVIKDYKSDSVVHKMQRLFHQK